MIICQTFFSRCSNCPASKTLRRSNKVSPNGAFNINLKSVHVACQESGYTGFKKIFSSLNLPQPVTRKQLNNLLKPAEASANRALSSSKNVTRKLVLLIQKENPGSVTMLELPEKIARCSSQCGWYIAKTWP